MHTQDIEPWMHDHTFGQDKKRAAEKRTLVVIVITALTMFGEIAAGILFGSMALLADGLHMGSHASALAISAFAYYYTRKHARDSRFNFGTGKVNTLAAFASAVMLVLFALVMAVESIERFFSPVEIGFNQAILVAVIGLAINGLCLLILGGRGHSHGSEGRSGHDGHDHDRHHEDSSHEQEHAAGKDHGHAHGHSHEDHGHDEHGSGHKDHNLWSAYLHVTADALTSLLAIFALLAAKYFGQLWLDPFMGILGALLVVRWSWGLLRSSTHVLLDMQAPENLLETIRKSVESKEDNRVSDLHVWAIGPAMYAAEIAVISARPRNPSAYWEALPEGIGLAHVTVEVHRCGENK